MTYALVWIVLGLFCWACLALVGWAIYVVVTR